MVPDWAKGLPRRISNPIVSRDVFKDMQVIRRTGGGSARESVSSKEVETHRPFQVSYDAALQNYHGV